MAKYYATIAGLPNIGVDDRKLPFGSQYFVGELKSVLTPHDWHLLSILRMEEEQHFLIDFLTDAEKAKEAKEQPTLFSYEELEEALSLLKKGAKVKKNALPRYFVPFFEEFVLDKGEEEEQDEEEKREWPERLEDKLSDFYYAYAMECGNEFVVLLLVQLFTSGMIYLYCHEKGKALGMSLFCLGVTLLALLFAKFVIPFDVVWVQLVISFLVIVYLLFQSLATRLSNYLLIALFAVGSIVFFYSADYVLNDVMKPHQRVRINVLLGLEEDLAGAGYNVHQSEIAIGSGGLRGKGFLNGTQTKLKFVPEQDTDFIFCTVGEEEGFLGSAGVLLLFLALVLRLIHLAERQTFKFGRVYGYCVLSIFLFHLFINVGMVLGLTPVIGIPLPFFSYGGSSLWGFTILLFIFMRIDAGRNLVRT